MLFLKRNNKPRIVLSLFLIIVITFFSFYSSLKNDFVNWDDDWYVTQNLLIRELSWKNIKQIFSPSAYTNLDTPQLYVPLVTLSYAFEYHFVKLNPFIYHLTNLVLHLLNCLLVFLLFLLLSHNISIAFIVAILFGIHPLHVESVAWITERKDVLYAFFFLSALICYIYYLRNMKIRFYYLVVVFFILSLLSKPLAISLPFVLLCFDYFLEGKWESRKILEKVPFAVLIVLYLALGQFLSNKYLRIDTCNTLLERFLVSNYALLFYIYKTFLPLKLSCLYPLPIKTGNLLPLQFLVSPFIVITLCLLVIYSLKYTKKIVFGFLLFLLIIFPALQFFPTGHAMVADRYMYLASIGIFYLVAIFINKLYEKIAKNRRFKAAILVIFLILIIGILSIVSWNRCRIWKDSIVLWNDVLKNYPNIATAYNSRGAELLERKQYNKAYSDFIKTLSLDPSYYEAYFNLANLNSAKGNYNEAIRLLSKTLQINPDYIRAYDLLVILYGRIGKHSQVIDICKKLIKIKPDYVNAYVNLSGAYGNLGDFQEAIVYGEKAVSINPKSGLAHLNLAAAHYYMRRYELAIKHCDEAAKLGYEASPKLLKSLRPYRK